VQTQPKEAVKPTIVATNNPFAKKAVDSTQSKVVDDIFTDLKKSSQTASNILQKRPNPFGKAPIPTSKERKLTK